MGHACHHTRDGLLLQEMRFGSYGALRQMPNTIWRNETSGRLRYGDEAGAVHLVTQVRRVDDPT